MAHTNLMRTLRWGAILLMAIIAVESVRYTWRSFHLAWRFSFGDPARWNEHWVVDAGTVIEIGPRIGYFAFWGAVIVASVACYLIGLYLLNRLRQLKIFDENTALGVRVLGLALAFSMALDQVFQSVDLYLLSRFNTAGPEPIAWAYDPSDIKSFAMGIILFLFGCIMQRGIEVARENEGFV